MAGEAGVQIDVVPHLKRGIDPVTDLRALLELRAYIRRHRFDVVHTHSSKGGMVGRWAAWLCRAGHSPWIVHTPHGHVFYGYFGPSKTRFYLALERMTARITDYVVALTEAGIDEYRRLGIRPRGGLVAIPSGVDFGALRLPSEQDRLRIRQECGARAGVPLVGTAARLEPIKGVHYLLRAMPHIKNRNVRLVIVGDGPGRESMDRAVRELGISARVTFTGWQAALERWISAMDVYVQPSINEGMGRTLVIGMYLGRVCVASAVGGIPSVIQDGRTGFLVPPADAVALAAGIDHGLEALQRDPEMGSRAAVSVRDKFSLEAMCKGYEALYTRLAGP